MADLNGDGVEDVVVALDQSLLVLSGRTGKVEASYRFSRGHTLPPSGTPTIGSVDGHAVIAVQAVVKTGSGPPAAGDVTDLYLFTTGRPLGRAAWPMFKRTGDPLRPLNRQTYS